MEPQPHQYELEDTQPLAPVYELHRVARINGVKLNLGTMPYPELMNVYEHCEQDLERRAGETALVAMYLDARYPQGPDAA